MKNPAALPVLLLIAVLAGAGPADAAAILYGADGAGGNPNTALTILDPTTGGSVSTVGPIGFAVTGMAFHPTTGVLYGTTGNMSLGTANSLITIDVATGAGTLVGPNGLGPVADIAFDAAGTLYGWAERGQDDLVTLDLTTGAASVVADSGLDTRGSGLAFDASGVLWSAGNADSSRGGVLRTIDPITGLSTGTLPLASSTGGRLGALAFDDAGTLFAADAATTGTPASSLSLLTIDTTTGVVTQVGSTLPGLDAIAFRVTAVPEPSAALLVAWGLSVIGVRRRR